MEIPDLEDHFNYEEDFQKFTERKSEQLKANAPQTKKRKIEAVDIGNESEQATRYTTLQERKLFRILRVEHLFEILLFLLARCVVEGKSITMRTLQIGNYKKGKDVLATLLPALSSFFLSSQLVESSNKDGTAPYQEIPEVAQVVYELGIELLGNIVIAKGQENGVSLTSRKSSNDLDILHQFIQTVAFHFEVEVFLCSRDHLRTSCKRNH